MLYFIPAWYDQNTWFEKEQVWYVRRTHSEFDDTVKQIQMFHRKTDLDYSLLVLNHAPNLRHFLHRQSIFHAPYWSCFDAIQEVQRKMVRTISFHDLAWPDGIEFIYTPFCVIAMLNGRKYAQVEFGETGNMILVDLFSERGLERRNIYDDRGFVSSSIIFQNNQPAFRDYYTAEGIRKCRLFCDSMRVEINPNRPYFLFEKNGVWEQYSFAGLQYDSLEDLVSEVVARYIAECSQEKDIFCIATHLQNVNMLAPLLSNKNTIFSFFENRFDLNCSEESAECLRKSGFVVADNQIHAKNIKERLGIGEDKIVDISPYDTREDEGISQHLYAHKILLPVDDIDEELFGDVIKVLGSYCLQNAKVNISLFTRDTVYNRKELLLEKVRDILTTHGIPRQLAVEREKNALENDLEQDDSVRQIFFVEQCFSELDVSKCLREQRVVLFLSSETELYLQILAVSLGIPQICSQPSEFVKDGQNGIIIENIENIPDILNFYLKSVRNWNRAHILSYEVGKKYSTEVLLDKWKEVIASFGENTDFTGRRS